MRIIKNSLLFGLITLSCCAYSQQQTATAQREQIQYAQEGCQKPIGFFPTPSKLVCMLTAFGIPQKQAHSKALAIVFNVCQGRTLQTPPAGITPQKYETLGKCLSDTKAITLINRDLTAKGYPPVKVVNPKVLTASQQD